MARKLYGLLGLLAPLLLWVTYFAMAGLRPDFSYKYKAISELGAVGVPNAHWWNVLGYLLPGAMIAVFAIGLHRTCFSPTATRLPMLGLLFSGLFMALSGVFPSDMDHPEAATSLLHLIGSFGSYLAFLVAAFSYPKLWQRTGGWSGLVWPSRVFTWLSITFGAWPMVFPQMPAVGQRVVFAAYSLWLINIALVMLCGRNTEQAGHTA